MASDWALDPASAVLISVLTATWAALVRRHPRWPATRSVAGAAAILTAVVATQSGVATHDTTSLTAHALQHVLLGMAVPLLAALAAPVTLVLQAADPATRAVVRRALHHPVARLLTRPVLGFVLFGVSVAALTFTPLLDAAARSEVVHLAVHVHLVLVGALFLWPLVGVDPLPNRPAHGARLLLALAAVPFHAFVGVALLGAGTTLFEAYPSLDDQRRAAGVLWGAGEVMTLATAAVIVRSWYVSELRAGVRADRRAVDTVS